MQNLVYLVVFCVILLPDPFVSGLECFQGERRTDDGFKIRNTLKIKNCSMPNDICHRYNVTATTVNGLFAIVETAECFPEENCSRNDCDYFESRLNELLAGSTIHSCCYICCNTENCNNECIDEPEQTTAAPTKAFSSSTDMTTPTDAIMTTSKGQATLNLNLMILLLSNLLAWLTKLTILD